MVKLIHSDQPIIKCLDPELLDSKAKRCMGADQYLVAALKKRTYRFDLAAIRSGRVAQVPLRRDLPIGPETKLAQWFIAETCADGFLRHDDNGLFDALIMQLVESDEHQRTALTRRGRRLDQQILLAPLFISAFLHLPHAHLVGFGRRAIGFIFNGDRGDGFGHCEILKSFK